MTNRPVRSRATVVAVAFLALLLGVSGCAAIPESSEPKPIPRTGTDGPASAVRPPAPPDGMDPLSLVRNFIMNSANPEEGHAAARQYLTMQHRESWQDKSAQTAVISDDFDTVPAGQNSGGGLPTDEQTVLVRGRQIGLLGSEGEFLAEDKVTELQFRVRLEGRDWRIAELPPGVTLTHAGLGEHYKQVRLFFLDAGRNNAVPDLRYVALKPTNSMPQRVISMLLHGPSPSLQEAVRSALPPNARTTTNVTEASDTALVVNLTGVSELPADTRRLIAAQVVLSLRPVTNSRIRLQADGLRLLPERDEWRPADVTAHEAKYAPSADAPGLMTVNNRLRTLKDNTPVPGPTGSELAVASGAQSPDGQLLAAVVRQNNGVGFRVGGYGQPMREVALGATELTRPTWKPDTREVWTVQDHRQVIRVVANERNEWSAKPVDAAELAKFGAITELRLSRDGVRVAAVVNGKLVVGSVVEAQGNVSVRAARKLFDASLSNIVGADWSGSDTIVVATTDPVIPVAKTSVDGQTWERFLPTNLTAPVLGVTAAPGRQVMVADKSGLWTASDVNEPWRQYLAVSNNPWPFYPG